jgi:hypothetical protein
MRCVCCQQICLAAAVQMMACDGRPCLQVPSSPRRSYIRTLQALDLRLAQRIRPGVPSSAVCSSEFRRVQQAQSHRLSRSLWW